eukprot:14681843-Ditylum_brightwellii.AAC.1
MWGWSETNINWTPQLVHQANYFGNKIFTDFTLVGSYPSGTCMGVIDKLGGHIIRSDTDTNGLGCWSYIKLVDGGQKQATIITLYQLCKQCRTGDSMVNAQQH